ncbi:Retrovirus-related Pol polyprotein from transposon RE2 [Vitis vinifera]|uniref:Retrovirus-related Pol polyprotein from transposon RE2 n=1 Tax=Vitis vinifera TaxID=29760 RepID=A0A438C5Y7_VITVI|nr:Retrovirus-related Pol polyprotein from transposon RE2 [Vitis vinifera]
MLKAQLTSVCLLPIQHLIFVLSLMLIGCGQPHGDPSSDIVFSWSKSHLLVCKKTAYNLSIEHRAEYRSMANTTTELTWMSFILKDLHIPLASTPTLYCDNTSALHMTINPMFHAHSKHIELDYHFCAQTSCSWTLVTQHISTEKQVVDLFTKPMSKVALSDFQTKLCLQPRHNLRRGYWHNQHLGVNCGLKELIRLSITMEVIRLKTPQFMLQ